MTPAMQEAAVRSALADGSSLAEVKKRFGKTLPDGIAAIEKEQSEAPAPRRSGAMKSRSSLDRRPTF